MRSSDFGPMTTALYTSRAPAFRQPSGALSTLSAPDNSSPLFGGRPARDVSYMAGGGLAGIARNKLLRRYGMTVDEDSAKRLAVERAMGIDPFTQRDWRKTLEDTYSEAARLMREKEKAKGYRHGGAIGALNSMSGGPVDHARLPGYMSHAAGFPHMADGGLNRVSGAGKDIERWNRELRGYTDNLKNYHTEMQMREIDNPEDELAQNWRDSLSRESLMRRTPSARDEYERNMQDARSRIGGDLLREAIVTGIPSAAMTFLAPPLAAGSKIPMLMNMGRAAWLPSTRAGKNVYNLSEAINPMSFKKSLAYGAPWIGAEVGGISALDSIYNAE